MLRFLAGAGAALLLVTAGFLLFGSWATPEARPTPVPTARSSALPAASPLPVAAPSATPLTREEKRFNRYDKDRNDRITRVEYLKLRQSAFAKLDTNHDGRLSFEEYAIKTTTKFAKADHDRNAELSRPEFATTAVKPSTKPKPKCPSPSAAPVATDGDELDG